MNLEQNINNNAEKIFNNNNSIIIKLINLTIQNNLISDIYFPLIFEKYKQLSFLKKKRNSSQSKIDININDNFIDFYKNENFNMIHNKKRDFSKKKDKNIFSNNNDDDNNKSNKIENCNYFYINKSNLKENELNNSTINKNIDEEINKKIKENIYIKEENNSKDNINKKNVFSNDIRVKKNNKMIYINKYLIKEKSKKKKNIEEKKRKGRYRGVSKNGNKWQTLLSYKNKNGYFGVYPTQEIAARVYDIVSIKLQGIKAKTNFKYDIHQIQKIIDAKVDFKSKNFDEILSNIIKEY